MFKKTLRRPREPTSETILENRTLHPEEILRGMVAQHHLKILAEAGALLSSSLDYSTTLKNVATLITNHFADWCIVETVDEDLHSLQVEVAHKVPEKTQKIAEIRAKFPIRPDWRTHPIVQAVFNRRPVLIAEVDDNSLRNIARNNEHLAMLQELGIGSYLCVPIVARGKAFGAISLIRSVTTSALSQTDLRVIQELSDRAAIAIDNARLYQEAQRATQMRQDLLAIVSHDLKNPLSAILMNTSLLAKNSHGEAWNKQIDCIRNAGARMNHLIRDLLDLALLDTSRLVLQRERINAEDLIVNAIQMMTPIAAEKKIRIEKPVCVPPCAAFEINVDRERILRVFSNLIGNAIQFSPPGSVIQISAKSLEADGTRSSVFSVSDEGPGIPEQQQTQIFERYWKANDRTHTGTGLGLSIVKGIIQAHRGTVWVQSRLGKGSTFLFSLPASHLQTLRS